jgi:hypothetical protein
LSAAALCAAAMAARILSYVSLINVGSSPVVPYRRCAAAMVLMPAAVGVSLNSTSPPPFTCTSMKPGASHAPSGSAMTGIDAGRAPRGFTSATWAPSMMTALSHSTVMPSKTLLAAMAWVCDPLISCW